MQLRVFIVGVALCGLTALAVAVYTSEQITAPTPLSYQPAPEPVVTESAVERKERRGSPVLTVGTSTVSIEIADTQEERAQGLSGRPSLPWDTGLWFVFPKNSYHSFWMPDMQFSIDIIWFDEAYRVVHIEEQVTPDSYPTLFRPSAPARYVLEVPAGYVKEKGIVVGSRATLSVPPENL